MSTTLATYRAALAAPGALAPVLASALGRFPVAMVSLATLLYVRLATGSFATAGLVSAGVLAGVSLGSVVHGRVIDRLGPTRPLLVAAVLFAAGVAALVTAVETAAAPGVLIAFALLVGLTTPGLPGASRALWSDLVPPGPQRQAAYSYEAISLEVFFILGPAAAALLVTAPWPGTGLVAAATGLVAGTITFALTPAVRARRPVAGTSGPRMGLGALAAPGLRTVALASLGFGLVVGVVEVGVPAVTAAQGSPALGGLLLSLWSVSSVLAGLLYGVRPWPRPLHLRMPVLLAGFGLLVIAMGPANIAGGVVALSAVMVAAGCLITPQVTAHSAAVGLAAPAGNATEAFGWVITAATLGLAAGQSAAGLLVDVGGPSSAFAAGGAAGLVLGLALWLRRRTLAPVPVPSAVGSAPREIDTTADPAALMSISRLADRRRQPTSRAR